MGSARLDFGVGATIDHSCQINFHLLGEAMKMMVKLWLANTTFSPMLLLLLSFASVFTDCFRVPVAFEMLKELRR